MSAAARGCGGGREGKARGLEGRRGTGGPAGWKGWGRVWGLGELDLRGVLGGRAELLKVWGAKRGVWGL